MVGDLKHGRTVRSLAYLLGKYSGIHISLVAPQAMAMEDDIKQYLNKHNVSFSEHEKLEEIISDANVIYQTRIQKERFESVDEYEKLKGYYILGSKDVELMKDEAIIMHPLPRVNEIDADVDSSSKAVYFRQAGYGLLIRMALLHYIFEENIIL